MAIAVTCDCGRSLKVKDALAGKKGRCPACGSILAIPAAGAEEELDYEVVQEPRETRVKAAARRPARDYEDEEDDRPVRRRPARDYEDEEDDRPARRRAARDYDDDPDEDRPARRTGIRAGRDRDDTPPPDLDVRKKPRRRRREEDRSSGWGISISAGTMGGLISMLIAVVWFVVGLWAGWVFFYPPILFILGLIAFIRGLCGAGED